MRQERWQQVKRILEQALEREPADRDFYLNEVCKDDPDLRREIESLIALDAQAQSFLETPVIAPDKPTRQIAVGSRTDMLDKLVGEVIDDKYRIEELLGQGGMGAVYKATHIGTDRPVALKIIVP